MCHESRVMCHMSCVTCHLSSVTCHMSDFFLQFNYFFSSGLGWTGELWSNCKFLILRNKEDLFILLFGWDKKCYIYNLGFFEKSDSLIFWGCNFICIGRPKCPGVTQNYELINLVKPLDSKARTRSQTSVVTIYARTISHIWRKKTSLE